MPKATPEAFRSADLFESGIGYVVISRYKADGRVEAGFFLVDVFCLGAKDAGFERFDDRTEFVDELLEPLFGSRERITLTPAAGRKLVEDAVAYARAHGLAPGADYKKASRVFGGISTEECNEQFVFGHEGRSLFIAGPNDTSTRCAAIRRALESHCGPGNFGFESSVSITEMEEFDDDAEGFDPVESDPKVYSAARFDRMQSDLEAMARRVTAERPNVLTQIAPRNRPALSDRLALVAKPLTDEAPDNESRRAILQLAALAWNFATIPPDLQPKNLQQLRGILEGPGILADFASLVVRASTLFPEEDRIICRIEIDFHDDDEIALRVASVSAADNPGVGVGLGAPD